MVGERQTQQTPAPVSTGGGAPAYAGAYPWLSQATPIHVLTGRGAGVMSVGLPAPVIRFISEFIDSAALLDVLLLLRAAPDKAWTSDEVARALVSTSDVSTGYLARLCSDGLVRREGDEYCYAPEQHTDVVDDLAEAYARRRHAVVGVIYGGDSGAAATLAEGFRIRKRRRDG